MQRISPTFRRLTLIGPDLHECADVLLDQRIKLILADRRAAQAIATAEDWHEAWLAMPNGRRPAMRTYTVAGIDRPRGSLDVDIACYPIHGPVSRFARNARPGDALLLIAPDGLSEAAATDGFAWRPGAARDVLIVGDETALPAVRNILAALPPGNTGTVVLELPKVADLVGLWSAAPGVEITVVQRSGRVGDAAQPIVDQWVRDRGRCGADGVAVVDVADGLVWDEPTSPTAGTYAWLAGEAGWIARLRRQLRSSGVLAREQAAFMGYWKQGIAVG